MVLSAPGMPQLQVPLTDPATASAGKTRWDPCDSDWVYHGEGPH